MTELFRNGKITRKASNSTQLEVPLMGEAPVQTRALANSRPSGGFFIAGKQVANGRTRKQQRICCERGWIRRRKPERRQAQEAPCWRAWNEGHQERRVHDEDRVPRHELQQGAALQVRNLRIRRPGVQGRRAHQRHGFSRQHQDAPRIRDVIPAIEVAGLEPAWAVLTNSRDTHVCRFRHVPVV